MMKSITITSKFSIYPENLYLIQVSQVQKLKELKELKELSLPTVAEELRQ